MHYLLNKHLDILYQTALEPSLWDTFLNELIHDIGAKSATLSIDSHNQRQTKAVSTVGTQELIEYLNILRPHITRSLQLSEKINSQQLITKALETSLDCDNRCVLIVDENAKLLYHNAATESLFRINSIFHLDSKKLTFNTPEAQKAFSAMLFELVNTPANISTHRTKISVCNAAQNKRYEFFISPINSSTSIVRAFLSGMNYVLIGKEISTLPSVDEYLKTVFGLTPKEIEVALALSQGHSTTNISDQSNRSVYTVRTQVKSLLRKLNMKSQNNLIVFLNGLTRKHPQ